MTRNVADAATLLTVLAGTDKADRATKNADTHKSDYTAALDAKALKGTRLGALMFLTGYNEATDRVFATTRKTLQKAGAEIVPIAKFDDLGSLNEAEFVVLLSELKTDLNRYLASTPEAVTTRTLARVIAFNKQTPAEMALFGQDLFEKAQETKGPRAKTYRDAAAKAKRMAQDFIDGVLKSKKLDALIAPTGGPAWTIDLLTGDHSLGTASTLPAVAGYPHITVPMGEASGLPLGLSFIGEAWSEAKLIALAYAFEQIAHARKPPRYLKHAEQSDAVRDALAPYRPQQAR
jgi:amidase